MSDTKSNDRVEKSAPARRSSFIHDIIDQDLASGKHTGVVTRFPPEPNGYLHIGHAKSIVLNFGLAQDYQGRCHLRFDDTNPTTEDVEYVESIQHDIKWLGYNWGEHLYFASDYFEEMYARAVLLIKAGKAYVDSLSKEEIREYRGTLTEAGRPSPYRGRSVEENLDLFARMRAGEFEDGACVLRAKIDMSAANMLMRDPLLYRIRHADHHRTGDKWCIYPMYDYAHGLEDAIECVTHSICTLEFENNRELYDWFIRETKMECQPRQYEFARLALGYTVMSKRKLRLLVEEGHVQGWDDPRMPTLAGMRRRGVTPKSIRDFCNLIGVAKANSTVDIDLLEYAIRDDLNVRTPRVMCVLDPLKVVITNYPEGEVEEIDAPYFPGEVPEDTAKKLTRLSRKVPFSREIYVEREDFVEEPHKKWYRLAPGREVRLRYGYFITCNEVIRDEDGQVVELRCTYDPQTLGGSAPDGRKVKGTLHWVSAAHALPATVHVYDRLFEAAQPDAGDADFKDHLNPESLVTLTGCLVEPCVTGEPKDMRYQFERQGYYWQDPVESSPEALVFNRIVSLRDSWAKETAKEAPKAAATPKSKPAGSERSDSRPNKKPASYERDKARQENPDLAARLERYQDELSLVYDDADLLSGDLALATFFEAAIASYKSPQTVAPWIVNEMLPHLGEDQSVAQVGIGGEEVGELVRLIDEDKITNQVSKEVFDEMVKSGKDAHAVVKEKGLEKVSDTSSLEPIIDDVLARFPDNVERYRAGKTTLLGFFIGQVMQTTSGAADAVMVRQLLSEKLA